MQSKPYLVKRPNGIWQVRFRVKGEVKSISTGTRSYQTARAKKNSLIEQWKTDNRSMVPMPVKSADWDSEIDRYLKTKCEHLKEGTKRPIKRHLKLARDILKVPVTKVTIKLFNEHVDLMRGDVGPKTWANILSNLKSFFKWEVDERMLPEDPTKNIKLPPRSSFGRRTVKDVWTDTEFKDVCKMLPKFERDVVQTIRFTGLDSSDVFNLRREHIVEDFEGHLCISKRREKAKSDDEHINQPLCKEVLKVLKPRIDRAKTPDAPLFPNQYKDSNTFGATLLKKVGRAWTMESRRKDIKSLRHTFATFHANRGVPEDVLRRWMGHSPFSRILDALYIHRKSTAKYMG